MFPEVHQHAARRGVPDLDRSVLAGRCNAVAVRAEGETPNKPVMPSESEQVGMAKVVKIEPFEPAKVGFPVRARAFPFEELKNPWEVGVGPVTLGKVHVGHVSRAPEPVHRGVQGLVHPADLVTLMFGFVTSELGLLLRGPERAAIAKGPPPVPVPRPTRPRLCRARRWPVSAEPT